MTIFPRKKTPRKQSAGVFVETVRPFARVESVNHDNITLNAGRVPKWLARKRPFQFVSSDDNKPACRNSPILDWLITDSAFRPWRSLHPPSRA